MIVVHHLENSRSQRVLWLLEELGPDYEVRRYAREPKTMLAPPELAKIHPLGKSPIIEDTAAATSGGAPRVVAETGAIFEYLIEEAEGRLGPPANREAVLRYRHFLHYAEGSLMPPLFGLLVTSRLGLLGRPARAPILAMMARHLDWLESDIAPWAPDRYRHNTGTGEDNAAAHLRSLTIGHEVIVPVTKGKLDFGPWQRVFYGEWDGKRPKRVVIKAMGA